MSAKSQQMAQSPESAAPEAAMNEGATDFGSNAAMQDQLQASQKKKSKYIRATVIQSTPHGDNDMAVLVGKGKASGIEEGWDARTMGSIGYVRRVFERRSQVIIYGGDDMNGEKAPPEIGRTVTIVRP